jgi:prepilin-type processing-associated H-X9-DG protein
VTDKVYSRHSGTFNVSFCDGHGQSLSNSMDTDTFIHLMTPSDRDSPYEGSTNPLVSGSGKADWTNAEYHYKSLLDEDKIK